MIHMLYFFTAAVAVMETEIGGNAVYKRTINISTSNWNMGLQVSKVNLFFCPIVISIGT